MQTIDENILKHEIANAALSFGLHQEVANDFAQATVKRITKAFGGYCIYIKKNKKDRNEKIRAEFTGNNYDELRDKFDVGKSQLRRILRARCL